MVYSTFTGTLCLVATTTPHGWQSGPLYLRACGQKPQNSSGPHSLVLQHGLLDFSFRGFWIDCRGRLDAASLCLQSEAWCSQVCRATLSQSLLPPSMKRGPPSLISFIKRCGEQREEGEMGGERRWGVSLVSDE